MASLDRGRRHAASSPTVTAAHAAHSCRAPATLQPTRTWATAARILPTEQPYLPHFGLIVATCERGDMRLSPKGILIHGVDGTREVAVPRGTGRPGQGDALDALWDAVREGKRSIHDARWGRDTIAVILAVLESSNAPAEVLLA